MALDNLPPSESQPIQPKPVLTKAVLGDSGVEPDHKGADNTTIAQGVHAALHADSYPSAPAPVRLDSTAPGKTALNDSFLSMPSLWSAGASTTSPLRLDNSPFQTTGALDFNAPTLNFQPRGDSALGPASLSGRSYSGLNFNDAAGSPFANQFDSAFFTTDTTSLINTGGSKLLDGVFDDPGDAAKLAAIKPNTGDSPAQSMLAQHQSGDSWTTGGTNYFKDKTGDLVARDNDGFHYYGANGMRLDAHGDTASMSVNGRTIDKVGNDYYKDYGNGEKVKITDKDDLKAIVEFEGHVFEQTKGALKTMNAQTMAEAAQHKGERIITASDGTAVIHTFDNGDVLGKNSKTHGAVARLQDGTMFAVRDDKVYKLDANGQPGAPLEGSALPPGMTLDSKSRHIMFHGVDLSGNRYRDTAHGVSMDDQAHAVNVQTEKGPVVASSDGGQEKIATPDHTFDYDCKANTYKVTNPDNSVDLSYNYQSQIFNSEGVTFTANNISFGDYSYSDATNSVAYNGNDVFSGDDDNDSVSSYSADGSSVQSEVSDANADASDINADLSVGNDGAALADAVDTIDDINAALGDPKLKGQAKADLSIRYAQAYEAIGKATAHAAATNKANELFGTSDPTLTSEIEANGDQSPAAILKRRNILPDTQIAES